MSTNLFSVSRLGISVNLPTGATYDILMVNTENFPVGNVSFTFSVPTSAKITGIQKCAQFFMKLLLTTKGSDLINPSYGTILPNLLIGTNANLTSQELISQITSAVNDAVTQCKALLNDSTNDDASKMDSVTISEISAPSEGSFFISMTLRTVAGETGSIALPSPLLATPVYNG